MFKALFSAAVNKPTPAGLPKSPQSRAIYAIDLMLGWHTNETGTNTDLCYVNNLRVNVCDPVDSGDT